MTPFLAELLTEAAEAPFGLEIISLKPLSLKLALVHAIAALPGCGLVVVPSRTNCNALWLIRSEILALAHSVLDSRPPLDSGPTP